MDSDQTTTIQEEVSTPTTNDASLSDILAAQEAAPREDVSLTEILARRNGEAPRAVNTPQDDAPPSLERTPQDAPDDLSEIERLRAQVAFFEQTVGDQIFETPQAPTEQAQAQPAAQQQPTPTVERSPLEPMKFEISDEEAEDITLNGNGETLKTVLARQAEVLNHNNTLAMQGAIVNTIQYALPTYLAAQKFAERNPELSMMPNADTVVQKTMWAIRETNPQASDAQLLRLAEKQLRPAIDKAKAIVSQGPKRKEVGASQQPKAATPIARTNAGTQRPKREMSTQEYVESVLRQHAHSTF